MGDLLVGLSEVKEHAGVPPANTSRDSELERLIEAVTPLIEKQTGPIVCRKFDEWHDGGNTFILPRRRPATSLGTTPVFRLVACSEYMGPIEWPLAIIGSPDEGELYSCMLDPDLWRVVRRSAGGGVQPFPYGPEAVHVIYEAGQSEVPANVQVAVLEAIREFFQSTQAAGAGRHTVADAEEGSGPHSLPYSIARHALGMIEPMRRAPSLA